MSYVDSHLGPGEQVVFRTRLHPVVLASTAVFAAFVISTTALIIARNELSSDTVRWLCLAAAGIVLVSAAPPILRWWASEFAVTNRRLLAKVGVLSVHTAELSAPTPDAIGVEQTLWGRLLGYGTLRLGRTAGTVEVFPRVARPNALRDALLRQPRGPAAARAHS